MKTIKHILLNILLIVLLSNTSLGQLLSEDFDGYTVGDLGTQGGWVQNGSGTDVQVANTSPIVYDEYNGGDEEYIIINSTDGIDPHKVFTSQTFSNSIWFSFIINVSSFSGTGEYFISLRNTSNSAYIARIYARNNSGNLQFGTSKGDETTANYSGAYNYGTTYLIVARYDWNTTNSSDDNFYVWINPDITTEPDAGTAEYSITGGTDPSFGSEINSVMIHQRGTNTPPASIEGLRISANPLRTVSWTQLAVHVHDFYSKSSGELNSKNTWGHKEDGKGSPTKDFTGDNKTYFIRNNPLPTITANWTVSGTGSMVVLGDGINSCTFTVPTAFAFSGVIDVSNNGTLKLQNTTVPTLGSLNNGSIVEFNQSASVNLPDKTYYNLIMNNPAGVSLTGNLNVTNVLTLSNGVISLNGYTFSYGSVTGYNLSGISETGALNSPSGVNLGGLGALITSGQNLGLTTVTRGFNSLGGGGNFGIKRWYKITPTINTGLNATLVFQYSETELNGIPENNLGIFKSTDDGASWTRITNNVTLNTTDNNVTVTGLDGFSLWTLGDIDSPLPVTLSSFISTVFNRNVKLSWKTSTETNNKGFEIERGNSDEGTGNSWKKIGYMEGSGTRNTQTSYTYEDKNLNTGKYKYRLKQIDFNGNYEYHELSGNIEIGIPKKYEISQNYPNPFNPVTKINFDLPENGLVNIRLYDMLGREVAVLVNEVRNAGYHTVQFDASKLSSGIYFYRMNVVDPTGRTGNFSGIKKMSVIK